MPEVRVRDVIDCEDVQIYRALAGGVTTARLLHGSANVIGGQDAVIKMKYGRPASELLVTDGPRGVKFALGENVKRTDGRFPNTRLGVEAVLVRAFTRGPDVPQDVGRLRGEQGQRPTRCRSRAATCAWKRWPTSSRATSRSTATATGPTRS